MVHFRMRVEGARCACRPTLFSRSAPCAPAARRARGAALPPSRASGGRAACPRPFVCFTRSDVVMLESAQGVRDTKCPMPGSRGCRASAAFCARIPRLAPFRKLSRTAPAAPLSSSCRVKPPVHDGGERVWGWARPPTPAAGLARPSRPACPTHRLVSSAQAALAQELSKLSISGVSSLEALTAAAGKGPAAEIHLISHLPAVLKATADKVRGAGDEGLPPRLGDAPLGLPPHPTGSKALPRPGEGGCQAAEPAAVAEAGAPPCARA